VSESLGVELEKDQDPPHLPPAAKKTKSSSMILDVPRASGIGYAYT
jgi:hypothetical protein